MSSTTPNNSQDHHSAATDWMGVVVKKIQDLRYGSVQITVHDGRVTLVESTEKTRFTGESTPSPKVR